MNEDELRALIGAVQQGELSVDAALSRLRREAPARADAAAHSDEFTRIRELARFFASDSPAVQLGIGDDAAVLRPQLQPLVLSVDAAVEGVHFERSWLSWPQIGARAMTAAVSDLAAMGARPLAALCSLVAPALTDEAFLALHHGIAQAARDYNCPVIGGNLASGAQLSLSTTVIGTLPGPGLHRSGARAGDEIYVSGPLGSAALGLRLLQQKATSSRATPFVEAWRSPRARVAEGLRLSGVATAAVDVSDGALADLGHICEASKLAALLEAESIPLAPDMAELAHELGRDPLQLALTGGEDYELIYTLPPGATDPAGGTRIGHMLDKPGGVQVVDPHGNLLALANSGYQHFR